MATSTWTGANENWNTAENWSTGAVPDASTNVFVAQGNPAVDATTGAIAANSIIVSTALTFDDGSGSVATFTNDAGTVRIDAAAGQGGTAFTVTGEISNSGGLTIGNNTLSDNDTIDVELLLTASSPS